MQTITKLRSRLLNCISIIFAFEVRDRNPYTTFPERVGQRILLFESVDYFGTREHFIGRKKKTEES